MEVCQLCLINEFGVTVDRIDFMSAPFTSGLSLRIPRATKRQVEYGGNLSTDGSRIAASRYNNAVITMTPRLFFEGCTEEDAYRKIQAIRARFDQMIKHALAFSRNGYGYRVRLYEDSNGFLAFSEILDGDFEVEEGLDGSTVAQGAILDASINLTRSPFRYSKDVTTLHNLVPNAGFEKADGSSDPAKWTHAGAGSVAISAAMQSVEGLYSAVLTSGSSGVSDATLSSTSIALSNGVLYYVEAWVAIPESGGDPLEMEIVRDTGSVLVDQIDWEYGEVVINPNDNCLRSAHQNHAAVTSPGELVGNPRFIRKGFFFTAPAGDNYKVIFRVTTPAADVDYYIDRVYLTAASNLPRAYATGTKLDPTERTADSTRFHHGWISYEKINNHIDSGASTHTDTDVSMTADYYHLNYIDVCDLPGDVAPDAAIFIKMANAMTTTSTTMRTIIMGIQSSGVPFATSMAGDLSGSADSTCQGGEYENTATLSGTWTNSGDAYDSFAYTDRDILRGRYHILCRFRDMDGTQGRLRLKVDKIGLTGNGATSISNQEVAPSTYTSSFFSVADLGVMEAMYHVDDSVYSGIDTSLYRIVYARRTTGTSAVRIDYLNLIPCDLYFTAVGAVRGIGENESLVLNSFPDAPVQAIAGTSDNIIATNVVNSGGPPVLDPNRYNRMHFCMSRQNYENFITDSAKIKVKYRSRWL